MIKPRDSRKSGSVLVVGGGIAGIQASLDLANSGFKVYLLEESPAIGGMMAKLDKTFPTNDCSMCIMSPKLVEAGRHPNIELITYSDLKEVDGQTGSFRVKVLKKARYVDEEKCTGCGECEKACPVQVSSRFDEGLAEQHAIYRPYPQALPNVYTIEKIGLPPCVNACPAGVNVQGYLALIREGKFLEAAALIRERNPFPGVCGRICTHICEENCNRNQVDEPLAIRALKRFALDYEMKHGQKKQPEADGDAVKPSGEKVAIVGSGPAGLTVAYDLARMGHATTVFEALGQAGGMLRVGVPRYRLPPEILDYDIEMIKQAGVEIRTNTPVGPDLTLNDLFHAGYEAIFIAIGTHKSKELGIEGEDLTGVIPASGFLHDLGVGKKVDYRGKIVAVIGGGDVAIDSVRTAIRLGAKTAFVIYRRSRAEIPANKEELAQCEEEGISFYYLAAPQRILGREGKVTGIECIRMKLGEPDESGRRSPVPIEGSTFTLDADIVIPAIGLSPAAAALGELGVEMGMGKDGIRSLPVQNLDLEGVYGFTAFLRALSVGEKIPIGKRVVVIGGGNVAMDVARSARRIGGEQIHVVCVEAREEMPAFDYEVRDAVQEGVIVHNRRMPKRIIGVRGRAVGLETLECTSVFDDQLRFNPQVRLDTESMIEADTVIVAIGQEVDYTLLKAADGVLVTRRGLLQVDAVTMQTNVPGIFAAGDAVLGPNLAIMAIAQGHEAAISIDRYLRGGDLYRDRKKPETKIAPLPDREIPCQPRVAIPALPVEKRIDNFEEVELELTEEQAIAEAKRCLNCNVCSLCKQCVEACEADAIDHEMKDSTLELTVGSIILAPGYDQFAASRKGEYGFGRHKNVVTSMEFERILSASGPFQGHVLRPSDKREPRKVAFLQCVGSRDILSGNEYCSAVCCMYAIKEALIAKEHLPTIEPTVFFMDMRAYGKDFDRYYEKAQSEHGIRFIRSRVSDVEPAAGSDNLILTYATEAGELAREDFDLVVLSVGLEAKDKHRALAQKLNLRLNEFGFIDTFPFSPHHTSRNGILVAGTASGPRDIPETVCQASGAAGEAAELLADRRGSEITRAVFPPARDISGQEPRIGVFICNCGINIGGVVDVPAVVEYARNLPSVVYAEENLFTCSQDTQEKIKKTIEEHGLNRVVVASCSPRTHEPLFQETLREAGLNAGLFEMANIRDQCSWIHMLEPEAATAKARDLVRMSVAKAGLLEPLEEIALDVVQKAVVIGGGLSGMVAALSLAEQGFTVALIEKEKELGGNLVRLRRSIEGEDVRAYLGSLIRQVERHPLLTVHRGAMIEAIEGYIGNYKIRLAAAGRKSPPELEAGVIILATGGEESRPKEYLYGKDQRIITQLELEEKLAQAHLKSQISNLKSVVMIQCVGSRDEEHPYCSRVCCGEAVKNALKLKEINPKIEIYVLFRDIRTYGFLEHYYRRAREKGIVFVRYETDHKPELTASGDRLRLRGKDLILNREFDLDPDLIVLAPAIVPPPDSERLAQMLKVPLNQDGFFLEAHVKLRPVDFATEGIFLAGLAHSPKTMSESVSQAKAAAARAATIISKNKYLAAPIVACVNEDLCAGCGLCVAVCSYNAPGLVELEGGKKVSRVNVALCKGCGSCAAACPSGAMQQLGFKSKQTREMVKAALEE